jgi:hypothetical protein
MSFQLEEVTHVAFTHVNVRRELHGEEHVRAVDIAMTMKGENTLLDLIEPGLREHHYCNKSLDAGQEPLPEVLIPLPNLRHANLPTKIDYAKKQRWRGYRFVIDYGLGGSSNVDFTDCVLASMWYELSEGGSVTIGWTIQYNGDELTDDAVHGRMAGLATEGEGHVQIIAPPLLQLVKKGWRSGKPDTPQSEGDGEDMFEEDDAGDEEEDTPEKAMQRAHSA